MKTNRDKVDQAHKPSRSLQTPAGDATTANAGSRTDRHGEYFHRQISVSNTNQPVWQPVTVASGNATTAGGLAFPANNQTLIYDADGNLTFDGTWNYQWDGENRLISMNMTNIAGLTANPQGLVTNRLRLDFAYDYLGRRTQKTVSVWNPTMGAFQTSAANGFVYDGWNLVAMLNPQSSILQSFVWGNDLSGTMTKAGGVGGLLMASLSGTNCFVGYDGNGNVTAFVNATNRSLGARYEYSPQGQTLCEIGQLARQNPFRFSTKCWDDESALVYFGGRYYAPILGRWISKDPAKEKGGNNLYAFAANSYINGSDVNGEWTFGIGIEECGELGLALGCNVGIYVGRDPDTGHWSWGVLFGPEAGSGSFSLAAQGFAQFTNAKCVHDLKGLSFVPGFGIGELLVGGADAVVGLDPGSDKPYGIPYAGLQGSVGAGIGLMVEAHTLLCFLAGWDSDDGFGQQL